MGSYLPICLLIGATVLLVVLRRKRRLAPLPPSPPGDFLIGHARVFPKHETPSAFIELGKKYGDVLYFNVLGQPIVVLNNYYDALNLLERRSANYSDRPACTLHDLMGYMNLTVIMRYGDQWRSHRKLLREKLLVKTCEAYRDIQLRNLDVLIKKLNGLNGDCNSAVLRFTSAIVLEIAYGHRISESGEHDEYLKIGTQSMQGIKEAEVATNLLDFLPFLRHVPAWVPVLSSATAVSRKYRTVVDRLYAEPFSNILKQMKEGTTVPCYVTEYIEKLEQKDSPDSAMLEAIRDTAAVLYIAGYDAPSASLATFINAMLVFPHVQRKVQEEIDKVVGPNRLPTFSDRANLPYVECVLQEVLSAMTRDDRLYRKPYTFYPERFLPQPQGYGEKHLVATFGFGRRICPGRHLVDTTLWIAFARILAVFDITSVIRNGEKIKPAVEFRDEVISHPKPFDCAIAPRSAEAARLIADLDREERVLDKRETCI